MRFTHLFAFSVVAFAAGCSAANETNDPAGTSGDPLSIADLGIDSPFFEPLGANGRACANCHQADQG